MRRFWTGTILLILLLAGSMAISAALGAIHRPMADALTDAAQLALDEQWEQAVATVQGAADRWERYHRFTAAFADHSPMDEADRLFRQLTVYAQQRSATEFAAACTQLQVMTAAIAESHRITWWNLL